MVNFKWVKAGEGIRAIYYVKIGQLLLTCKPEIVHPWDYLHKQRIVGWKCSIHFGDKWIIDTKTSRVYKHDQCDMSLKLCQRNAEKLATEHMLDLSFVVVNQLKKMGLFEEILLEVGVEI